MNRIEISQLVERLGEIDGQLIAKNGYDKNGKLLQERGDIMFKLVCDEVVKADWLYEADTQKSKLTFLGEDRQKWGELYLDSKEAEQEAYNNPNRILKENILKVLSERTRIEERYNGGYDIPILSVIGSDDISAETKEDFLGIIADEILAAIANK